MRFAWLALVSLMGVLLVAGLACGQQQTSENAGKFEIYLPVNWSWSSTNWYWSSHNYENTSYCSDVENVTLQENPIISIDDIRSYNWSNHCIELTEEGCHHVATALGEPYHGLNPFVVVANGERIYIGSFYSIGTWSISSLSPPPCPIVWIYEPVGCSLNISRDAWNSGFFGAGQGNTSNESDVRYDSRIYEALKQSGKLIE